ncbi:hypothetical protein chiPu_0024324, partial [Chiloscyllium punctatum]|nr:hypothetical protein [Chiloscyllium punctatum]
WLFYWKWKYQESPTEDQGGTGPQETAMKKTVSIEVARMLE